MRKKIFIFLAAAGAIILLGAGCESKPTVTTNTAGEPAKETQNAVEPKKEQPAAEEVKKDFSGQFRKCGYSKNAAKEDINGYLSPLSNEQDILKNNSSEIAAFINKGYSLFDVCFDEADGKILFLLAEHKDISKPEKDVFGAADKELTNIKFGELKEGDLALIPESYQGFPTLNRFVNNKILFLWEFPESAILKWYAYDFTSEKKILVQERTYDGKYKYAVKDASLLNLFFGDAEKEAEYAQ